ncbi:hypothetical protein ACIQNI_30750 [Streptomyces sp. NPDC091266]|uniref:hypothetical protein n=1 Tax=Streptomyces sp. NPDC091266 TaxID=3365978 RepID=UPI0037FBB351
MQPLRLPTAPGRPATVGRTAPDSPLYIAPRQGEFLCDVTVLFDEHGHVYYEDERPDDRDVDNILWERWGGVASGPVAMAHHHPVRQREVMDAALKCAVCKGEPDRDDRGVLWLLHVDDNTRATLTFPTDITTATPAVCAKDAVRALEACQVLQRGFIAVRVREAEIVGVRGTVYSPTASPLLDQDVRLDDDRIHKVAARQLLRQLRNAELDETTLSTAGLPARPGTGECPVDIPGPVWG